MEPSQAKFVDLMYAVANSCTPVASARVQMINITVRRDIHVCVTSLGMTFIQSCTFWAQSLHPLHVVSCETSHVCGIQGN